MKKIIRITESELIKLVKQVIREQSNIDFKSNSEECFWMIPNFYFEKTTGMETQDYDGGDLWFWNENKIPELNDKEAYNRFIEHIKYAVGYKQDGDKELSNPEMILNENCFDYENVPSWEELLPGIEQMYYDTIRKKKLESQIQSLSSHKDAIKLAKQMFAGHKSNDNLLNFIYKLLDKYNYDTREIPLNIKRRLSEQTFLNYLNDTIYNMNLESFDNEFQFAEHALQNVLDSHYGELEDILDEDAYYEFYDYLKYEYGDLPLEYFIDSKDPDYDDNEE